MVGAALGLGRPEAPLAGLRIPQLDLLPASVVAVHAGASRRCRRCPRRRPPRPSTAGRSTVLACPRPMLIDGRVASRGRLGLVVDLGRRVGRDVSSNVLPPSAMIGVEPPGRRAAAPRSPKTLPNRPPGPSTRVPVESIMNQVWCCWRRPRTRGPRASRTCGGSSRRSAARRRRLAGAADQLDRAVPVEAGRRREDLDVLVHHVGAGLVQPAHDRDPTVGCRDPGGVPATLPMSGSSPPRLGERVEHVDRLSPFQPVAPASKSRLPPKTTSSPSAVNA